MQEEICDFNAKASRHDFWGQMPGRSFVGWFGFAVVSVSPLFLVSGRLSGGQRAGEELHWFTANTNISKAFSVKFMWRCYLRSCNAM